MRCWLLHLPLTTESLKRQLNWISLGIKVYRRSFNISAFQSKYVVYIYIYYSHVKSPLARRIWSDNNNGLHLYNGTQSTCIQISRGLHACWGYNTSYQVHCEHTRLGVGLVHRLDRKQGKQYIQYILTPNFAVQIKGKPMTQWCFFLFPGIDRKCNYNFSPLTLWANTPAYLLCFRNHLGFINSNFLQ